MILDDARTWEELVWREFSVRYPRGIREGQILIASDSGKSLELSVTGTINQEGARQNVHGKYQSLAQAVRQWQLVNP